jgi:uncharacterized membrane protein YccC
MPGLSHPYEIAGTVVVLAAMMMPAISQRTRSAIFAGAFVIFLIGDVLTRQWADVAIDVAVIAVNVWTWWKGGGWRRKAAKLLGQKSKALRDALVRRAREVAKPRPVRRPVPVPG